MTPRLPGSRKTPTPVSAVGAPPSRVPQTSSPAAGITTIGTMPTASTSLGAKTNSFDVRSGSCSVSPIDNWSAGAIEVREGPPTDNGEGWELSRHYFCKVDYGGPDRRDDVLDNSRRTGANSYEFNGRLAPGDPTVARNRQ